MIFVEKSRRAKANARSLSMNAYTVNSKACIIILSSNLFLGVVISFEMPEYSVSEGDGPLEVCAQIVEGSLEREVTVTLFTSDMSATGKMEASS